MKTSRREFLEGATAAAAGVALVGGLDIARTAHAAGSDELKIALIGCGHRGTGAVRDCLASCENVRLVAMGDAFEEPPLGSLERLRKDETIIEKNAVTKIDVPADRIFVGLDAFQKVIDAGPDIVFLATPPGFRPAHYAAAVAAGKHVFLEKPICVDAPGFRWVMETNKAANEKGSKWPWGSARRHSKQFLGPVKAIQDGSLGRIAFMRCYCNAIRSAGKLNDGWHGTMSSFTAVLGRMATYSGLEVDWHEAVERARARCPPDWPSTPTRPACPTRTAAMRSRLRASTNRTER